MVYCARPQGCRLLHPSSSLTICLPSSGLTPTRARCNNTPGQHYLPRVWGQVTVFAQALGKEPREIGLKGAMLQYARYINM